MPIAKYTPPPSAGGITINSHGVPVPGPAPIPGITIDSMGIPRPEGYHVPAPATGGGGYTPPPAAPNAGDFNSAGQRWNPVTGTFEAANLFSDLTGGGSGGGGGGPASGAPGFFNNVPGYSLPPTLAALGNVAPGSVPYIPPGPSGGSILDLNNQALQGLPEDLRPYVAQFLQSAGYQGTGNIGSFGEQSFIRPGGEGQFQFAPEQFMQFFNQVNASPRVRDYLKWFMGQLGYSGVSAFPGGGPAPIG